MFHSPLPWVRLPWARIALELSFRDWGWTWTHRVALWFFIYLVTTILKTGPGSNVIDLNLQFQSHHRAWKMSLVLYIQYSNRKLNLCNFLDIDKQKPPIRGLPDTSGGNFPPMQPAYKDLIGLASLKWPPGKLSLTGLIIKSMGYLSSTTHWTPSWTTTMFHWNDDWLK